MRRLLVAAAIVLTVVSVALTAWVVTTLTTSSLLRFAPGLGRTVVLVDNTSSVSDKDNGYVYWLVSAEPMLTDRNVHLHFALTVEGSAVGEHSGPVSIDIRPTDWANGAAFNMNVTVSSGQNGHYAITVQNPDGRVAVDIPPVMTVGEKEQVAVRLSLDRLEHLSRTILGRGPVRELKAALASVMAVRLEGDDDFRIVPLVTEEQAVMRSGYSEWLFDVTPLGSGSKSMKLFLRADLAPSAPRPLYRETLALDQIVRVAPNIPFTLTEFIKTNWATLLGLPILAWALRNTNELFSRRRNRAGFA